jgi:hypothetical protein
VYPDNDLSYAGNLLGMLFKTTTEVKYKPEPALERALDVLFVLHADHEQNCSTSAMRSVASSGVDPHSAVAAAAAALYGPLHGGANEAVLRMLRSVGSVGRVPDFVRRVKAGEAKLMGFGHRVYENYDPRARVIKRMADEVFAVTRPSPLLPVAGRARADPALPGRRRVRADPPVARRAKRHLALRGEHYRGPALPPGGGRAAPGRGPHGGGDPPAPGGTRLRHPGRQRQGICGGSRARAWAAT